MGVRDKTKQSQRRAPLHYPSVPLVALLATRSKHHKIVADILNDLKRLATDKALKIDLAAAGVKKADLCSALHRAANKRKVALATTSDDNCLYVFHPMPETGPQVVTNEKPASVTSSVPTTAPSTGPFRLGSYETQVPTARTPQHRKPVGVAISEPPLCGREVPRLNGRQATSNARLPGGCGGATPVRWGNS
jgi:hypothetical protein